MTIRTLKDAVVALRFFVIGEDCEIVCNFELPSLSGSANEREGALLRTAMINVYSDIDGKNCEGRVGMIALQCVSQTSVLINF